MFSLQAVISFSAWEKSHDSTPMIFFLEHKMRPLLSWVGFHLSYLNNCSSCVSGLESCYNFSHHCNHFKIFLLAYFAPILFEVQKNGNWTDKIQSFELPFDMPVNSLDQNVNELEIGLFHLHSRWLKFTFWTSKFSSSYRSNWTGIWTGNSNGSWTCKQSSHFRTAKGWDERKSYILFHVKPQQTDFEMMLKCCWNSSELVICKWWTD